MSASISSEFKGLGLVDSIAGTESLVPTQLSQAEEPKTLFADVSRGAESLVMAPTPDASPPADEPLTLLDIGANLLDPMFLGIYHEKQKHESDLSLVLERAAQQGVGSIMVTAGSIEEAGEAIRFIEKHAATSPVKLFTTAGVHPCRALELDADDGRAAAQLEALVAICASPHVVALGELGLDYDRFEYSPKEAQLRTFEAQLKVAGRAGKPLFLHSRAAEDDFISILSRYRHLFKDGVVHSFTGTRTELDRLLSLGLFIGINGCSAKTEENLEVLRAVPLERLMLETDAPWCEVRPTHASSKYVKTTLPVKKKPDKFVWGEGVSGRCEPWMMRQVLEVVAGVKGVPEETIARHAHFNTRRVFGLV